VEILSLSLTFLSEIPSILISNGDFYISLSLYKLYPKYLSYFNISSDLDIPEYKEKLLNLDTCLSPTSRDIRIKNGKLNIPKVYMKIRNLSEKFIASENVACESSLEPTHLFCSCREFHYKYLNSKTISKENIIKICRRAYNSMRTLDLLDIYSSKLSYFRGMETIEYVGGINEVVVTMNRETKKTNIVSKSSRGINYEIDINSKGDLNVKVDNQRLVNDAMVTIWKICEDENRNICLVELKLYSDSKVFKNDCGLKFRTNKAYVSAIYKIQLKICRRCKNNVGIFSSDQSGFLFCQDCASNNSRLTFEDSERINECKSLFFEDFFNITGSQIQIDNFNCVESSCDQTGIYFFFDSYQAFSYYGKDYIKNYAKAMIYTMRRELEFTYNNRQLKVDNTYIKRDFEEKRVEEKRVEEKRDKGFLGWAKGFFYKDKALIEDKNLIEDKALIEDKDDLPPPYKEEQKSLGQCSICKNQIYNKDNMFKSHCEHSYHLDCYRNLMKITNKCFICQENIYH